MCKQCHYWLHTNRGWEDIVLMDTTPHGPQGWKGDDYDCGHPTPLILLGKQSHSILEKAGLLVVAVGKENANVEKWSVRESAAPGCRCSNNEFCLVKDS